MPYVVSIVFWQYKVEVEVDMLILYTVSILLDNALTLNRPLPKTYRIHVYLSFDCFLNIM